MTDSLPADAVALRPVPGVMFTEGMWRYPLLNIQTPAPPDFVHAGTDGQSLARAEQALDLGIASVAAAHTGGRFRALQHLLRPSPLPLTIAAPVPFGAGQAMGQAAVTMLQTLRWPMLAAVLSWVILELAGQPVLALLASLAFLILLSLPVHELGHLAVFRLFGSETPALFSARVGRFRLVRADMPQGQDIAVTVAGPAATLVVPVLLLPVYNWLYLQFWLSVIVALSHLFLLSRKDGDGAMLRLAMRTPSASHGGKTAPRCPASPCP